MGLDCSHDAWSGAYSAFHEFRCCIGKAWGAEFPFALGPSDSEFQWWPPEGATPETHPGLFELLSHSDCDGEISPAMCAHVADELTALLPEIAKLQGRDVGHIAARGGLVRVTELFIAGCREAAAANEPLEFG